VALISAGQGAGGGTRRLVRLAVRLRARLAWVGTSLVEEQERWFCWAPVLFGLGIAAYFLLPTEPRLIAALAPVPAAVALRLVWRRGVLAMVVGGALLAATLGLAAAKLRTEWVRAPVLTRQIGPVEVKGIVELVEPRASRGERITIRVTSLGGLEHDERPIRVRVRTMSRLAGLKPGDAVRVRATLAPPAGPALPGGYDFARSAWFQSLGGVGYAMSRAAFVTDAGPPPTTLRFWSAVERVRLSIGQAVVAALPGQIGAIANALITGERGGISEATNAAFRDSGLYHVLSISGLHMVIMAGAAFWLVRFVLALVPALALRFPIKKWAAVIACLAALGYLLISGSASATVRSWIMISIMFLAIVLDRPAVALRNVALAALAILLVMPESLHDAGFQMSFAAVVALVATYEALRDYWRSRGRAEGPGLALRVLLFFGGIVLSTLIASIAVAPLAAYHFHKSQQFAILANLLAIPICNVVVMPAALAALLLMPLGLEGVALAVMGVGIEGMLWCANLVARLPGAVGHIAAIPTSAFALMLFGGLWLCLWRTRWRLLGVAPFAAGLALTPTEPRPDLLIGGREGTLVAVRGEGGRLHAAALVGSAYELTRWLEHDGDARAARDAAAGTGFRCDAAGCVTTLAGKIVAVPKHPAALADDCARADILILRWPRDASCAAKGTVVDYFDWRRGGAHALYLDDRGVRITTVQEARGNRPWSAHRGLAARRPGDAQSRLAMFAAPAGLLGLAQPRPRPEVEDDEPPTGRASVEEE
jgi:competence protein ComEC